MKRRKWDATTQCTIVLEGLKGTPVGTMCQDYQISQTQYAQWRDPVLANAPKTFEVAQQTDREARLQREHPRLKNLVGELTLELKQSDVAGWLGPAAAPHLSISAVPLCWNASRR